MAFSLAPLYGQGGTYTAQQDRLKTQAEAVTSGVRKITAVSGGAMTGDLAVTVGATSRVNVAAGDVWIPGAAGQGFYYAYNDAAISSPQFTSNSSGSSRTDLVYVQVTDSGSGNPTIAVAILAGSVVVPVNSVGLATVVIPNGFVAGTTNVLAANITDVRKKAQLWDLSVVGTGSVASATAGNVIYDATNTVLKSYSGTAWQQYLRTTDPTWVNGSLTYAPTVISTSANPPSPLAEGLLWYQTDTDRLLSYTGTAWVRVGYNAAAGRTGGRWSIASGTPQSFATGTAAFMSWTVEAADSDAFLAIPSTTFTVPAGMDGQYVVSCNVIWSGDPTGNVAAPNSNNASTLIVWNIGAVEYTTNCEVSKGSVYNNRTGVTGFATLAAGDSFQIRARQVSGGTLTAYGILNVARIGV